MDFDFFEGRPHDVPLEHRRRINAQIHERYRIRDLNDPLAMTTTEFRRLYRMPQGLAVRLHNEILPHVRQRISPQHTSLLRKVLVTLSILGMGAYQRLQGRSIDCAMSQSAVSNPFREVVMALNAEPILTRYIRFPLTPEERAPIIQRNEALGMTRTLAFLDGSLCRLTGLPRDNERQSYFTRKGWTGLNVQLLCDASLTILNVDARFPGSLSDHVIWEASAARRAVEAAYWESRCWVLGDSGYYEAPWLHTPIPHALEGTPEYHYTQLHCYSRNCIERCIGVLKGRFRILCSDRALNYKDAAFCGCIVNACCVLHNFCLHHGEQFFHPLYELDIPDELPPIDNLPMDLRERAEAELQYLVNYAHQRHLNRGNIVNAY